MLSALGDARAAERFFRQVFKAEHNQEPNGIALRVRSPLGRETLRQRAVSPVAWARETVLERAGLTARY